MDSDWCPGQHYHCVLVVDLDQRMFVYYLCGGIYSRVCGRMIGCQDNSSCFWTILWAMDNPPRQYIWTFYNAVNEARSNVSLHMQYLTSTTLELHHFCETAWQAFTRIFYPDDPTVRDVGYQYTVSLTTHCGSASNSFSRLQIELRLCADP